MREVDRGRERVWRRRREQERKWRTVLNHIIDSVIVSGEREGGIEVERVKWIVVYIIHVVHCTLR